MIGRINNSRRLITTTKNIQENNAMWKGDQVGYGAVHDFVIRRKIKSTGCENCGKITKKLDLANISGDYKRDLDDWEYLCRKCHMIKDGRINKVGRYKKDWKKGWETRRKKYGGSGRNI